LRYYMISTLVFHTLSCIIVFQLLPTLLSVYAHKTMTNTILKLIFLIYIFFKNCDSNPSCMWLQMEPFIDEFCIWNISLICIKTQEMKIFTIGLTYHFGEKKSSFWRIFLNAYFVTNLFRWNKRIPTFTNLQCERIF
jgi:hypothetical protein